MSASAPISNPEELAAAYDEWYGQWGPPTHENLENSPHPYHDAAIEAAGGVFRGASVIDISCGDGRLSRQLLLRGAGSVDAIDISEEAVAFARAVCEDAPGAITFEQGSIEAIPRPAASFDVAFCCETVEHVLRPRAAIAELKRVLKPGGTLILTAPNYLSVLGARRIALRVRDGVYTEGGQPVNNVTTWPRTAWWLRKVGFSIEGYSVPRFSDLTVLRAHA